MVIILKIYFKDTSLFNVMVFIPKRAPKISFQKGGPNVIRILVKNRPPTFFKIRSEDGFMYARLLK